ncbi:nucleoside-diphosphate-sugar epimerase family protein [Parolsenella catena]|uniref:Nucleoside-diphosphate-sugar epimerase family protein n=1 Tax=Parolsenella catena TaxID=2003188 RepID=A0A3G9KAY9_9ACTN|nr:NAD(P)-dependent oxidoreductase [Parolsenella catena]BBH50625.1 nucleoside-diphosphate-sugar epimerase family protein [Parolsenella catena]
MSKPLIAVTGANGYIGRHVVEKLKDAGARVIALDLACSEDEADVLWKRADILDDSLDCSAIFEEAPDALIHLAWRNGFKHDAPTHLGDLSAHYRFVCKMNDFGVDHIVCMGTMHEIGYWEGAIDENTPCNPRSLYGVSKDALRRALELEQTRRGFCFQWLRGFYICGDDEKSQSIFGKLLRAARSGETTFPFTTGKNKYDFTTVDQLAGMIAAVALQDEVVGTINCCSGEPMTLAERVEQFIADNGLSINLEYGAFPDRPYDSPGVWGDPAKIRRVLSAVEK